MIPPLLLLTGAALSAAPVAVQDTVPFADTATRQLVEQAMARHRSQDSVVRDYTARINYRLSVSLGRRKWAMPPIAAVEEQAGRIQWEYPNNLRVDIDGTRFKARNPSWRMESTFDSPWFVPRGLGDSVRVFGNDFPEVAAIHPLSSEGPSYYRYAAGDTLSISTGSSTLRVAAITVTPSRPAPSLVAGRLWVDLASAEVVRFTFKYVGTGLWAVPEGPTAKDTAEARTANKWANRILSIDADLEYALQENRYWMPYRQVLSGRVQIPIISDIVIPFDATTTFEDYEINTGKAVVFHLPPPDTTLDRLTREERRARMDTLRQERSGRWPDSLAARERGGEMPGGGRFEIRRPPRDSLRSYAGWEDSLTLDRSAQDDAQLRETQADLARMAEKLDRQITGYQTAGVALERLSDIYRNNRVQGQSLGFGYAVRLPPDFTSVYGSARYGLADGRFLARLALIRDAPEGKVTVAGYRDIVDADPFSKGLTIGNSLRAAVFARDDGDYFEAIGGSAAWERPLKTGLDLTLTGRLESQRSVATQGSSWFNDLIGGQGEFLPNAPVLEGTMGTLGARLDGISGRGTWWLATDALIGEGQTTGRFLAQFRQRFGGRNGLDLKASAGVTTSDPAPQAELRAGGSATVRGFDYGVQRGQSMWSLQTDWSPGRGGIRPVFFGDVGQAGRPGDLSQQRLLVGGGAGVSVLDGLLRAQLTYSFTAPQPEVRFEIVIGSLRL